MKSLLCLILVLQIQFVDARPTSPINTDNVKRHVENLTKIGGRLTGSESEKKAAAYIDNELKNIGIRPWSSQSYKHPFEFTAGTNLGSNNRLIVNNKDLVLDKDYRPLVFSGNGQFPNSQVVFAGYGITEPEFGKSGLGKTSENYDSYKHLDVKNKWVLVMRFMPEDISAEQRIRINRFSSERIKVLNAHQHGAKGVIFVHGINTVVNKPLIPLAFDATSAHGSTPVISINKEVVNDWFKNMDKDWKAIQEKLDAGKFVMGFEINGVEISANIDLKQDKKTGKNVMAYIKGSSNLPAVIIGAHYDHLGKGNTSASLARDDEMGFVHPGADDNASGVASLLAITEYLVMMKNKGKFNPKRDVIFAFWSGEELGLLGSNHLVKSFGKEDLSDEFMANLNLDMIGRMRETAIIQGTGSSSQWNTIIEQRNAPVGLNITLQEGFHLPTDAISFYSHNVPVLSAFTGSHGQYHSPRDTVDLINYDGIAKISKLFALIARGLALQEQPLDFQKRRPKQEKHGKPSEKIYLGTIPEYGHEGKGVLLSGTAKGSPAEIAGLQSGDVLVEMAGVSIETIYDFMHVLEMLKVDKTVTAKVKRGGRIVEIEVTPGSR